MLRTTYSRQLRFYDADCHEMLAVVKFLANHIDWDPSGRFLLTQQHTVETVIWSFRGEKVFRLSGGEGIMKWGGRFPVAEPDDKKAEDIADDFVTSGVLQMEKSLMETSL